jgi:hypothetical protein
MDKGGAAEKLQPCLMHTGIQKKTLSAASGGRSIFPIRVMGGRNGEYQY